MQQKTEPLKLQVQGEWPATRSEGWARLSHFVAQGAQRYSVERNYDLGPENRSNVSVLSPYVRHRLITEDELVRAAVAAHGLIDSDKFIQEVAWRTYWKGWLELRPAVWESYLADVTRLRADYRSSEQQASALHAAETGATGIACFDAWVLELIDTGYLHNHSRMWFASIWIYTLNLPWQLGAAFFLRHLLDGDPASNTLSWRWMCGLHTAGKTYLARPSNIAEFTRNRFDPPKVLAVHAPPVSASAPTPKAGQLVQRKPPPPVEVTLLMTSEDLLPETLPLGDARVQSILLLDTSGAEDGLSDRVRRFKKAALDDAAQRAGRHFWCPVKSIDVAEETALAAVRAQQPEGVTTVVMAELPTGTTKGLLQPILDELPARGVACHKVRREWDQAFWPLATSGFFKFKDSIPDVLSRLGVIR
jgi:deoxyribodipyrimidine photo-lyase